MPKKDIIEWTMLGRKIGTATGWDQHDTMVFGLYDFTPRKGLNLPNGDVTVDFERGTMFLSDVDGEETHVVDLVTALSSISTEA